MADAQSPTEPSQAGFVLWYRSTRGHTWEAVHRGEREMDCVRAIGCGERHNGEWLILPDGREP